MEYLVKDKEGVDCSHFELVILASQRSYDLKSGSTPEVLYADNDKEPVIALRELYQGKLDSEKLYRLAFRRMEVFSGSGFSDIPADGASKDATRAEEATTEDLEEVLEKSAMTESEEDISFSDDEEE